MVRAIISISENSRPRQNRRKAVTQSYGSTVTKVAKTARPPKMITCFFVSFVFSPPLWVPLSGREFHGTKTQFQSTGITSGCGQGLLIYCPMANVTRSQLAVFLERSIHGSSYNPPMAAGTIDPTQAAEFSGAKLTQTFYLQ